MMVTKAIEILSDASKYQLPTATIDLIDAIKLAIEALERHRDKDYITYNGMHARLPSETLPGELAPHSQSTSYNP